MSNLIIIGYPGIGKTTVSKKNHAGDIIDLQSELFYNYKDGSRDENWYYYYCRIAYSIAMQGNIVLVSSHECVRRELRKYKQDKVKIITIAPHKSLQDEWISKLRNRYFDSDMNVKNRHAWEHVSVCFEDDILSMSTEASFCHIFLYSMDYDLLSIIRELSIMFGVKKVGYLKDEDPDEDSLVL